jgi:glycosyltransferase involved in cell wall biosynthesis
MVGWARRVKDPLWALEILAPLRAVDPSWRLTLVGTDFPATGSRAGQRYARAFRERVVADDVRGAVDFVGFTRDLAPLLASSGFVLSTSRRESFALGLVEAAASGAVPVVRDWPVFARLGGARGLFPGEWVVDDVEEAVSRILGLGEQPAWTAASEATLRAVAGRFGADTARARFQEIVLGDARA